MGRIPHFVSGKIRPLIRMIRVKQTLVKLKREKHRRRCFGEYQNVLLSDDQLAALQADYPGRCEEYINRLSAYMASSGKHYADHYATIRKWLDEDSNSSGGKRYDYSTVYEEGECL